MASNNNGDNNNPTVNSSSSPSAKPATVCPPWTQAIRRESDGTSESGSSESSVAENGSGSGSGANVGKKPVWNKPANGSGPVMEASMWPALGESAKGTASKSFPDSSEGSASGSQKIGGAASLQKPGGHNTNSNATPNHVPGRQRSMKRNGSSSSFNGGSQNQHISAPPSSSTITPPNNHAPGDHSVRTGFASQSHGGHDQSQQRNSYRNRNGGSHSRGDSSHFHNYGNRREQDWGNQDWGNHRNFNGRGTHMQPQRGGPSFMRPSSTPPPNPASLMSLPMRPYHVPVVYPGMTHPMYYNYSPYQDMRAMQYPPSMPAHPIYMVPADPQLRQKVVNQIDYYFSNENLVKDIYLRQNMDGQGWVSLRLIAGFRKMRELTSDVQTIIDYLQSSTNVEVQGERVRKRNDWERWIMPPVRYLEAPGPQVPGSSSHELLNEIQNISLGERTSTVERQQSSYERGSLSREVNTHTVQSSGLWETGQVSFGGDADENVSSRR